MERTGRIVSLVFVGLALSVAALSGEGSAPTAPSYGVDSTSVFVVSAWDMVARFSTAQWESTDNNLQRYYNGVGSPGFWAGVHVPQGARILSIELEACDSSATGTVGFALGRLDSAGFAQIAFAQSGVAETPGCGRFAADLASPEVVDNVAFTYVVAGSNTSTDGLTSFGAVRVYYQLQVSPAPGTATFNDVPTSDPGFQFIEALVSSGITAGCGNGNYCPDAPLTRRQMAVFLSKALGLHWPEQPAN